MKIDLFILLSLKRELGEDPETSMENIKNTSYLWDECCSPFPEKRIDIISNHKLCSFRIWESTSDLTRHSDVLFCILALKNPLLFTIGLTIYLNLIILPHCT